MTVKEQLKKWVKGISIHNKKINECCPDFSCCRPHLKWPEEERKLFYYSSRPIRDRMLVRSLESLIQDINRSKKEKIKAYITGP